MTDSGPKVNIHPSASPDPLQVQGSGRTNKLERANEDLKSAQAELQRRWQYLAEAQKLSHSGTFGWKVGSGELVWSDRTYRILGFTRETNPTLDLVFDRIHPEDRAGLQEIRDRATQSGIDLNVEQSRPMASSSTSRWLRTLEGIVPAVSSTWALLPRT